VVEVVIFMVGVVVLVTSPSPHQDPITRSMMRKIDIGLSEDDQVNHRLFTLFSWAKEISKI